MPSLAAMKIMAGMGIGAAAAGYEGYKYAQGRSDFDKGDRMGFSVSALLAGAAAGGAAAFIGPGRIMKAGSMGVKAAYKAGTYNPLKNFVRGESAVGKFMYNRGIGAGIKAFKPVASGGMNKLSGLTRVGGVMAATAALGVGTMAMTQRHEYQKMDTAETETGGGYTPTPGGMTHREKMGILGATGDMVFGLNNSRHG